MNLFAGHIVFIFGSILGIVMLKYGFEKHIEHSKTILLRIGADMVSIDYYGNLTDPSTMNDLPDYIKNDYNVNMITSYNEFQYLSFVWNVKNGSIKQYEIIVWKHNLCYVREFSNSEIIYFTRHNFNSDGNVWFRNTGREIFDAAIKQLQEKITKYQLTRRELYKL